MIDEGRSAAGDSAGGGRSAEEGEGRESKQERTGNAAELRTLIKKKGVKNRDD